MVFHCFVYRDMFCAGRVVEIDMKRTIKGCGGAIMSTAHDLCDDALGTCKRFEERQIGAERYISYTSFCGFRFIFLPQLFFIYIFLILSFRFVFLPQQFLFYISCITCLILIFFCHPLEQ